LDHDTLDHRDDSFGVLHLKLRLNKLSLANRIELLKATNFHSEIKTFLSNKYFELTVDVVYQFSNQNKTYCDLSEKNFFVNFYICDNLCIINRSLTDSEFSQEGCF